MSFFLTYSAESAEYFLTPAGYFALIVLLVLALFCGSFFFRSKTSKPFSTKQLVFCSLSIALGTVASYLKIGSLPFGGSITLFSMFFISLTGYIYGVKTGIMTGIAYGILQLIADPYIYAPLQVLLDFPLAFCALGLSGLTHNHKAGLIKGYILGVAGRYLCHVLSGYIFFAHYAPENMNPLIYTLFYNATYLVPEMLLTIVLLCLPAMSNAVKKVRQMAAA